MKVRIKWKGKVVKRGLIERTIHYEDREEYVDPFNPNPKLCDVMEAVSFRVGQTYLNGVLVTVSCEVGSKLWHVDN